MSRRDLTLVASRLFALLLVVWALVDVSYMPEQLFALFLLGHRSLFGGADELSKYHLIIVVFACLRIIGLFLAAALFWKCGLKIEELFWPEHKTDLE